MYIAHTKVTILIACCFSLAVNFCFGQTVAGNADSINYADNILVGDSGSVKYQVIEAKSNLKITSLNYTVSNEKMSLTTLEDVQFISVMKGDALYLPKIPIKSSNIILSLSNYEEGNYQILLHNPTEAAPTVIDIVKY